MDTSGIDTIWMDTSRMDTIRMDTSRTFTDRIGSWDKDSSQICNKWKFF